MPGELPDGIVVVLEQVADLGPLVQQPTDPYPRDQANAGLDPARPVHSAEKRVRTPPGAKLVRGGLGVALVTRQPPGRRQHRDVVMTRHLPHLLDVARLRLVPMIDAKRQPPIRRPSASHRVVEPIRVGTVDPRDTKNGPCSGQHTVGSTDQRRRGLGSDLLAGRCRQRRDKGPVG